MKDNLFERRIKKYFLFFFLTCIFNIPIFAEIVDAKSVTKVYISTLDRAPDSVGLDYWINSGFSIEQIAQSFFDQQETKDLYDGLSNGAFVTAVYNNLFSRNPDQVGYNYWTQQLNNGMARYLIPLAFANGAQDSSDGLDKSIIAKKIELGLKYAITEINNETTAKNLISEITVGTENVDSILQSYQLSNYNVTNKLSNYNNTAVILVMGQSNIANHGSSSYKYKAGDSVFNYNTYGINRSLSPLTREPSHFATGNGGSMLPLLGDKLVNYGYYDSVVFINIAMGGSSVAQWANQASYTRQDAVDDFIYTSGLLPRIDEAKNAADSLNLTFTHILWHQGETDKCNSTSTSNYISRFNVLRTYIRQKGITAPIYMARASYQPDCDGDGIASSFPSTSTSITNAQISLINNSSYNIEEGPNTDLITNRDDLIHFDATGLAIHADRWYRCLTSQCLN